MAKSNNEDKDSSRGVAKRKKKRRKAASGKKSTGADRSVKRPGQYASKGKSGGGFVFHTGVYLPGEYSQDKKVPEPESREPDIETEDVPSPPVDASAEASPAAEAGDSDRESGATDQPSSSDAAAEEAEADEAVDDAADDDSSGPAADEEGSGDDRAAALAGLFVRPEDAPPVEMELEDDEEDEETEKTEDDASAPYATTLAPVIRDEDDATPDSDGDDDAMSDEDDTTQDDATSDSDVDGDEVEEYATGVASTLPDDDDDALQDEDDVSYATGVAAAIGEPADFEGEGSTARIQIPDDIPGARVATGMTDVLTGVVITDDSFASQPETPPATPADQPEDEPVADQDEEQEEIGGETLSQLGLLEAGEVIADRYRVKEELGAGAMGTVYRVHDLELNEDVALKALTGRLTTKSEALEQFKQEIRLARRIVHRNVCRTYDFGRWDELLFVTMELIDGTTLEERIRADSLGEIDAHLALFRDILIGVRAAHSLGIVHHDLKPMNIMVTPDEQAVVMDFGLAQKQEDVDPTGRGVIVGTPPYIAPERWRGLTADHRSDIYALGVVLFEMITGRLPFTGNPAEIGMKHVQEEPPRIRDLEPDLPESIDVAVTRMLAKDPDQRYGSVDEVLEVLAEIRSTPVGRTVLLAEGNEDLRSLIEHHLAAQGLMVEVADDGEQAVELLLREKPDMVVLDVEIPKIDGLRVTEILRRYRHLTEVPVYLLSRVRDEGYVAYAKQLNVTRLIKRPFAVRPFAREVRMTMGA